LNIFFFFNFSIGMNVSTKGIGNFEREDITDFYKFPESEALHLYTMVTFRLVRITVSKNSVLFPLRHGRRAGSDAECAETERELV